MSKNIEQIFVANPITTNASTDLMYFGQSPYGAGNDAAMTFVNFKAQFGATYTAAALTEVNDVNVTLTLGGLPNTALLQPVSITAGWSGTLSSTRGGTGVNNGTSTITIGGNFSIIGAFTFAGTLTGNTAVTFPTSGTLATTSQIPSLPLSLANGGTFASLTASNGGVFYSTATSGAILAGTATANQVLLSGSSTTPSWSVATYPATTTVNQLLYSSATNTITGLATVNSSSLSTNASGVPTWLALTDGQIVIGSSIGAPLAATLTGGTGVTITNTHNSITITSNGADPWVDETGAAVTMTTNTGYTSDDGSTLVTFTLPTTSAVGDWVEINGKGAGLWKIAQAAGQQIHFGTATTTSGTGGSLASVNQYDTVRLRCLTASTIWTVVETISSTLTVT
jgi:hypothetical protein